MTILSRPKMFLLGSRGRHPEKREALDLMYGYRGCRPRSVCNAIQAAMTPERAVARHTLSLQDASLSSRLSLSGDGKTTTDPEISPVLLEFWFHQFVLVLQFNRRSGNVLNRINSPLCLFREYNDQKPPDKSRFPGGSNNGLPSAGDSACLLRYCSDLHSDTSDGECSRTRHPPPVTVNEPYSMERAHRQDLRWCPCINYQQQRQNHSHRPDALVGDLQPFLLTIGTRYVGTITCP
ncbi:hypothetical protein AVEN_201796-1 [Araneus ventricosus]|uniref:Uncharacterized protein n=1 Tax=Araneus ventricosus TaxID=182803 RepID=A0A4Y2KAX1_ARAVE|nr:hypothetical protein AVEN_201796-1 [Araneus ventricosus]